MELTWLSFLCTTLQLLTDVEPEQGGVTHSQCNLHWHMYDGHAGGKAEVRVLDWSEEGSLCTEDACTYEMVIGADLVYNLQGVAQLLTVLKATISAVPDIKLYLGHCSRQEHVDAALFAGLEDMGLAVTKVAASTRDKRTSMYVHV